VVSWLGAVQAQDYAGGKWAVGLRLEEATNASIEQALADRAIVRTWPMRGTLHFVAAADVRWMLALLAPRPLARAAARHRQLELDEHVFRRARRVIEKRLRGGRQLTRGEVYRALNEAGIATAGQRGVHILARFAHEALIVFGAGDGMPQTIALLEEWVPPGSARDRDAALAELARRYVRSHGPATAEDFTWWSGLAPADARAALGLAQVEIERDIIDGQTYWHAAASRTERSAAGAYLLPPFDEYLVAYRDRTAVLAHEDAPRVHALLSPTVVAGGRVVGTWRRRFERDRVAITIEPFRALSPRVERAVTAAAQAYASYAETSLAVTLAPAPPVMSDAGSNEGGILRP
jgi:hypothetical protein